MPLMDMNNEEASQVECSARYEVSAWFIYVRMYIRTYHSLRSNMMFLLE